MLVLVTGVAGFIGAALAERLLARGDTVIGIDNCNDYYDPALKDDRIARIRAGGGDFTFHRIDFADMAALDAALDGALDGGAIDAIVHLGAQAGVRYSLENPAAYVQSNLVGHANMLEIARQRGVAHMVYASSSSVYGGNEKVPFSVEDRADHPVSLYAATKRADELMSESYAHLFRIPLTGLRFFTVYGPWGRPDMAYWLFTRAILAGGPVLVNHKGEMWRDFTHIDDIISGIVSVLDKPPLDDGEQKAGGSRKPHAIYNIGNNRSEKLIDMVRIIEDACGRKAQIVWKPMPKGDVLRTYADIDAMQRDHGYCPTTSIAEGLPQFVKWYREYHSV